MQPKLIIIGGFAGAGKSTVARRLAKEYPVSLISTDDYSDAMVELTQDEFHSASAKGARIYWHIVSKYLSYGVSVVLDLHMARKFNWEMVDRIKDTHPDTKVLVFILKGSWDLHENRVNRRGIEEPEHNNLGGDKLEDIKHKYEFIENLDRDDIIEIDTSGTKDEVFQTIINRIK